MTALSNDLRKVFSTITAQGWRVEQAMKAGHFKCYSPDGKTIVLIATSGDYRGYRNAVARLRRAGANVN